jgi:hypothetical protein
MPVALPPVLPLIRTTGIACQQVDVFFYSIAGKKTVGFGPNLP